MNLPRFVDRLVKVVAALTCFVFLASIPASVRIGSGAGARAGDDLQVVRVPDATLSLLVRNADAGERPVAQATVRVFLAVEDGYSLVASGQTGQRGKLVLSALPRGAVWILVEAAGRARRSVQRVLREGEQEVVFELSEANRLKVRVEDDRGAAISEATVLLTGPDTLPFGALTTAEGNAVFERIGASPWRVRVAAKGYEPVTRTDLTGDTTVTLHPLSALVVRVVDRAAKPVPEATIWIAGATLFPARRLTAADDGRATISGLEAGAYELKARRGDLVSETEVGVPVRRGERNEVTLVVEPGRFVTVHVTDGEGDPPLVVGNADVVLAEGGVSSFPLQGRTNTLGEVVLGPIATGPAVVGARAEGFVPRAAVAVDETSKEPVRVPLLRGAVLRGTVVDSEGRGVDGATVEVLGTDLDGLPIAETPMMMAYRDFHFDWALGGPAPLIPAGELGVMPGPIPPIPGSGVRAAALAEHMAIGADPWVTRLDGSFVARPITPGRVRALVRHPEFVEGLSDAVTLGPGGEASVRIVLHKGGFIEGRVVDEAGIPVAGARVDVRAVAGTLERTTLSATDGTFAFAAIPRQAEIALARPDDLSRLVWRAPVDIPEGERVELDLVLPEEREVLSVSVTASGGAPIELAQVTALSLDPRAPLRETRFTDEKGRAEIPDAVGLELQVVVEAPGHAPWERTFGEAPTEISVALELGVPVEGQVTAVRGRRPVAGAEVVIVAEGRRLSARTDDQGLYRFQSVPAGSARIVIEHPDFADEEREVRIDRPARADRVVELPAIDLAEAGRIRGKVVDAAGKAVGGARVAVGLVPAYLPLGALPPDMAKTDGTGHFVLGNVTPGTVDVEAYSVEVGRGRASGVVVEAGRETSGVTIALNRGGDDFEPAATGSVAVTLGESPAVPDNDVVVMHVASNSEAERAGLRVGDIVLAVDDVDITTLKDARTRMSGAEGSDVLIDLARGNEEVRLRVRRERVRR